MTWKKGIPITKGKLVVQDEHRGRSPYIIVGEIKKHHKLKIEKKQKLLRTMQMLGRCTINRQNIEYTVVPASRRDS